MGFKKFVLGREGAGRQGGRDSRKGGREKRNETNDNCDFINIMLTPLGLIFALNVYSVPWSYRLQVFLTVAKVLGLIMIILMGFVRLAQGKNV